MLWGLLPLAWVVVAGFLSRGEYGEIQLPFSLENYRRLAGWSEFGFDALYPRVLLRTVGVSAGLTLLTLLAAVPLAFFIAGLPPRRRALALALVIVPFWTSLLVRTYAWQILLGQGGPLDSLLAPLGGAPSWMMPPGWFAVMAAMFSDYLPFMVLPVYVAVERLDWALPEAAADLGAGAFGAFRHGILPQIFPGIRAGALMVFLPATGQFVIPDLLGGGRTTLWGNLIQQQFGTSRDWPFGAAAATVTLALLLGGLAALRWRDRRAASPWMAGSTPVFAAVGAGPPPRPRRSWGLCAVSAGLYGALWAPLAVVTLYSFNESRLGAVWRGFTLAWYRALWEQEAALAAMKNSLVLAASSAGVATILGTLLGYGLGRLRFRGRHALQASVQVPILVPDVVFAVALVLALAAVRRAMPVFEPGLFAMFLGHVTFQIPFVAVMVQARVARLDPALEEAARDLGATGVRAFWHVTRPLLTPAMVSGALLAFTLSLDDFAVSFFTSGPGSTTLPLLIYASARRGITPDINALATLLMGATLVAVWLGERLRRSGCSHSD